ncbi:MAG: preprotein translocase subunit YajC [Lachnospiraceae bacterium]|jgi:preprotein translocase subunit YajC|nr:preprotein translocase subunit YajC [Lachnospiraceae bacterium]
MGILLAADQASATTMSSMLTIGMVVVWVVVLYFVMIRPQKTEQKKLNSLLASLEIGDSVMTTSGFFGVVIDITDDTVIVEFGSDRHCRIPMNKTAIAQVEKPEGK